MTGDFTRWTYTPTKNYSSVLLQQGRVLLDSDWNEEREIDLAGRRALARDLIGAASGPIGHTGFGVEESGGALVLRAGRYYVDGILCELHADTPVASQPDLAGVDPTLGLGEGRHALYLDVWERHVTHIEDPDIKEKALGGPDHTTRLQIVAQARLFALERLRGDECDTLHDPDALAALIEGTRGRLAASVDPSPPALDPCIVPATAGYRGLENQLYRVEVHRSGNDGTVTFKWSRNNGSGVTAWDSHPDPVGEPAILEVADLGPDEDRGFKTPDLLVELLDDTYQLAPGPGLLAKIASADEASRTITLKDPVDADGNPVALTTIHRGADAHHPRVRRWDCASLRPISAVDENDGGHDWIELESGIRVRFELGAGQTYRSGDYWLVPARTVDGTIAWAPDGLQAAHGPHHRYACLAIVIRNADGTWSVERSTQTHFPSASDQIHMRYVGGDGQQGVLGRALPSPLQVQVLNGGVPLAGASVRFAILEPPSDGELSDGLTTAKELTVTTDPAGVAGVTWKLASEAAWSANHGLIDQRVQATLLDACGDDTRTIVVFSTHESQAVEVRYDNTVSPPMAALHAAGYETDHVQRALDVLCGNPHLDYTAGDGQEAMPGEELPNDLVVRVGNGAFAMAGVTVDFRLVDLAAAVDATDETWAGSLDPVAPGSTVQASWTSGHPRVIRVTTDANGLAWVRWRLGTTHLTRRPGMQARIVLPGPYDAFAPGAAVRFAGRWSLASQVGYTPACEHLAKAGVTTVQAALDALCTDRTLYYVGGTAQPARLGQVLPVPLEVRVANEGQPIAGAFVRFRIVNLAATGTIGLSTGGTLDRTGPGVVASTAWPASTSVRTIRVQTDARGLARATWRYAGFTGDAVPGVEAVLLDENRLPTTSIIRFSAVLQSFDDEAGIHVLGTAMRERNGTVRPLHNDSTVDPFHLLEGIQIDCDAEPDLRTLAHKRTTHVRIQVPYGWRRGALDTDDPYFAPVGVQHHDEHILAGDVRVLDRSIVWVPTTAARRQLVLTRPGPVRARYDLPMPIPPQDWPLPARLVLFGGGESRVRATLTVEGDFVTDRGGLHVDGEALGKLAPGGRIELGFPSGNRRAGGDFRTWFWLEGRLWSPGNLLDQPTGLVPRDHHAVAVTPVDGHEVSVVWANEGKLLLRSYGTDKPPKVEPIGDATEEEQPGIWLRSSGQQPDGFAIGILINGSPRVLRVDSAGKRKVESISSRPPRAASAPRGVGLDDGQALAWVGVDAGLHAAVQINNKWAVSSPSDEAAGVRFLGHPIVLADPGAGKLHVLCEGARGDERTLMWFERSSKPQAGESWVATDLGATLPGWKPAIRNHVVGASGIDFEGERVSAVGWMAEDGELFVARRRGSGPWSLETPLTAARVAVDLRLDSDCPIALAIDQLGMIHVVCMADRKVLDLWADHRTPWTLTDVSERAGLGKAAPRVTASPSADGRYLVVAALPRNLPQASSTLLTAWFGLPWSAREAD